MMLLRHEAMKTEKEIRARLEKVETGRKAQNARFEVTADSASFITGMRFKHWADALQWVLEEHK